MIKNEYHHGNLKEEFLQIAFDFIAKEDIDKLTLKILSDATGTSRSAIYKHFKSKDALVEMIIEMGFVQFDDAISPTLKDKSISLIDRFYLGGKLYIAFALKNPNLYKLLFGKKYSHIRDSIMSIKDDDCSGFGALKLAIEEGQEKGILKKDDSYKQTIVIWSALHGLSLLMIDGFMDVKEIYEDLYDSMFETLLAGIVANKVKLISSLPFGDKVLKPKSILGFS
ncbi:MAG: TetR/AcrR family transcriptional regulator [Epsilonproteobacteria bacterium]|nr:MAG: TetR/AcrR family transcriptional regulator [Campylobacterota bacterium]